jgi:hypothetical protein
MKNYTEEEKKMINGVLEGYTNRPFWMGLSEFQEANGLTPKPKLEVGKWYKSEMGSLFSPKNNLVTGYGFSYYDSSWRDDIHINKGYTPATKEEVETALTKEAEKRGYTLDSEIVSFRGGTSKFYEAGSTCFENGEFWWNGCIVMKDGVWAEIVKVPEAKKVTMSEVEKKFGCKVEIIND